MLMIENMSYHYDKERPLFDNLSLNFSTTVIYGLKGASGTGKTTFSRLLANYLKPTKGQIGLSNCPARKAESVQLISQNPEEAINPSWKISKLVQGEVTISEKLQQALGIKSEWFKRYPGELSGGELQRLCIGRALAAEPRFLIADEMTAMLDSVNQAAIWTSVLRIVKAQKIGLIVVSHDEDLLNKICDQVIDINELKRG